MRSLGQNPSDSELSDMVCSSCCLGSVIPQTDQLLIDQ